MNEELQSTNEELHTMNDELRNRSLDLNSNNDFLEAVFTSLQSGVIVLERDLRVHVWNAGAMDMWGLRPEEAQGRPFLNLDIGLRVAELQQPIRDVLNGVAGNREVVLSAINRRGRPLRCRTGIAPLLTKDNAITGIILIMEEDAPD